ncbi:putative phosphatase [compost metagenome]
MGDGYNDIAMLEFAGLGVAMGNAPEEIKELADYVTDTNMNDGVAQVVESFILKDLSITV